MKLKQTAVTPLAIKAILCLVLWFSTVTVVQAQTTGETNLVQLRLIPPPPEKKLLIISNTPGETAVAAEACAKHGIKVDVENNFNPSKQDYSSYHTLISCSNQFDDFDTVNNKKPEAFAALAKYVRDGGHFIILGNFGGRNTEHLQQFGIVCAAHLCKDFSTTHATKMFFEGVENIVPEDKRLQSVGNFTVSRPHVALLNRGETGGKTQPALVTLEHHRGRVTFCLVEPYWKDDMWLITALMGWMARGSPTPGYTGGTTPLRPVPDAAAIKDAEGLLHEVLAKDFSKIGQASGKLAWATRLTEYDFSGEPNLAVPYVAWNEARANAAAVGDINLAFRAINLLSQHYQIDLVETKIETLAALAKSTREKETLTHAAHIAVNLLALTIRDDNYSAATQVASTARGLAQKSQMKHLQALTQYYDKRAKLLSKEFQKIDKEANAIQQTSEGSAARTAAGRFYCFLKADWVRGLPLLAGGDDAPLKQLAERELAVPTQLKDQIALADDWWQQAEALTNDQRGTVQRHAGTWYQASLGTATGVERIGIMNKLAKVSTGKAQLLFRVVKNHGFSKFIFTPDLCEYRQLSPEHPASVTINDLTWDIRTQGCLLNEGSTRLLNDNIDVFGAKLIPIRGRGTVRLDHTADGLVVTIDDPPEGADNYEFKLAFGGK
ncbi:MAG: hypothetical protein V4719_23800 [Planctomycetota bacterium]